MVNPDTIFGRLGNKMFQGAYLIAQAKKGLIPDIYIQDPAYFEDAKDEILNLYRQGIAQPIDQVAIHVRRGDYVNNSFYIDLIKTEYYERAMEEFPGCEFLVFSDDIEWCRQNPIFENCEFFDGTGDPIMDMNVMAACTGHVIANSSYSWWASYISPYTKKVVAPVDWYSDGIIRTKCPSEWVRV